MPSPRRGASGTPPPTVANRELCRYGRRPRRPVGRPPYASPAKRSSLPGLLQPCRGRACPARGLTKAPACGKLPRADIESAPTGNRCRPFCGLYVGRGALTPPRGVGDAAPYSGEPRTFPLWQTSAKRSSLPGLLQPCRGRACPARGLTESARLRETTPGGYRIRPYGKSLPPPTVANRGRTSRKPIFQQQPPPVVENFPGGRRFIARK